MEGSVIPVYEREREKYIKMGKEMEV